MGNWRITAVVCGLVVLLGVYFLVWTIGGWDTEDEISQKEKARARGDKVDPDNPAPSAVQKVFTQKKINLGLDLQGGIDLVLGVGIADAVEVAADRSLEGIVEGLTREGIENPDAFRYLDCDDPPCSRIGVTVEDDTQADLVREFFRKKHTSYQYLETRRKEGKQVLVVDYVPQHKDYIQKNAVNQVIETIRNRIDEFGVTEPVIAPKGSDQVTVQLPGVTDQDRAVKLIGQTAQLEFRMMDASVGPANLESMVAKAVDTYGLGDDYSDLQLNRALESKVPETTEVLWEKKRDELTGESARIKPYLLKKNADLTGDLLADAFVGYDQFNVPYVGINFNPEGADIFCNLTKANTNEIMAIVLDDVVRSAPRIDEPICGGRGRITLGAGNVDFLQQEAADLVIVLQAGALPAPVQIEQNRTVGATLGADSVRKGVMSMAIGALLVIAFLMVYYRGGGVIANLALGTNIVLILAALSAFGATLTLPGIAGIILTIGMAVDANIIIFERIREELRLGKSPRVAVAAGFDKAWWTIMDANITTFIAGVVLYSYGTGPLKGFAVTLMIGILTTLFSALVVARLLFTIWTEKRELKRLSI